MLRLDGVVAVVDADNDAHGKYLHYLYSTLYMKRLPFGNPEFLHEKSGSFTIKILEFLLQNKKSR